MTKWKPKLKYYKHFDKYISEEKIYELVQDPIAVKQNSFYPFLLFFQSHMKFGGKKENRDEKKSRPQGKERPIRYPARRDSYIFSYYRHLLSEKYEKALCEYNLQDTVIAYRKVPEAQGTAGKCNIHFARDAFLEIKNRKNSYAIALDISDYFGSINHRTLRDKWCKLMGFKELPGDHEAVYKAITQYSDVEYDAVMKRLGYTGEIVIKGVKKQGFLVPKNQIPLQLCSNKDFREKICGKNELYSDLIQKAKDRIKGIPQGSPISDLLANLYLLEFDQAISEFCQSNKIFYRRYSDDLLFICPLDETLLSETITKVKSEINKIGKELIVKDEKTIIKKFEEKDGKITCTPPDDKKFPDQSQKPIINRDFEYLGFSFDGKSVKLRDSTVSRFYRKIAFGISREARELSDRYNTLTVDQILNKAPISQIYQKYGKINDFYELESDEYNKWNFWTYASRAAKVMEAANLDNKIMKQIKRHKKVAHHRLFSELRKAKTRKAQISKVATENKQKSVI